MKLSEKEVVELNRDLDKKSKELIESGRRFFAAVDQDDHDGMWEWSHEFARLQDELLGFVEELRMKGCVVLEIFGFKFRVM